MKFSRDSRQKLTGHPRLVYLSVCIWILRWTSAETVGGKPEEILVRLSGGYSPSEGRVEVRRRPDTWGTVCHDGWDLLDATVVCRYLGYRFAVSASAKFGRGRGRIWLDEVECHGDEVDLADCSNSGWGDHDCRHKDDAGVVCSTIISDSDELRYSVGSIRLVGGTLPLEGRVEVYLPDQWGAVCSDRWSQQDASVVCRQLGYNSVASEHTQFGNGSGVILLSNVICFGNEDLLADCLHRGWGHHSCTHTKDVGVVCSNSTAPAFNATVSPGDYLVPLLPTKDKWLDCDATPEFRLAYGVFAGEGLLQVRCAGQQAWRTVPGDSWETSTHAHRLACRHLGFSDSARPSPYVLPSRVIARFGSLAMTPVLFCSGDEYNLQDCCKGFGDCECTSYAGLKCIIEDDRSLELRLVHSRHEASGVLQGRLRPTDEWGALCGHDWDKRHASVACRHLGFVTNADNARIGRDEFGMHLVPNVTLLYAAGCYGNETDLSQCDLVSSLSRPGVSCSVFPFIEYVTETSRFDFPAYLCGKINYCGIDCNEGKGQYYIGGNLNEDSCRCDKACHWFQDCCYDYASNCKPVPDWTEVSIDGTAVKHYACVMLPVAKRSQYVGFSLVSFCPDHWANPFLRANCEEGTTREDVIGSLPVYVAGGAVYKNIFCAVCHGVQIGDLYTWNIRKIGPRKNTPAVLLVYSPPRDGANGTARLCPGRTVRSCPDHSVNQSLRAACEDYYAPVDVNGKLYHNPHCAMCNGELVHPTAACRGKGTWCWRCTQGKWDNCLYQCKKQRPSGIKFKRRFGFIQIAFDFDWGNGGSSRCEPGQLYDPFLDRCRTFFCQSGQMNAEGKCVNEKLTHLRRKDSVADDNCTSHVNKMFGTKAIDLHMNIYNSSVPTGTREELSLSVVTDGNVDVLESDFLKNLFRNQSDSYECDVESVTVYLKDGILPGLDMCSNSETFSQSDDDTAAEFTATRLLQWIRVNASYIRKRVFLPSLCFDVLELMINCSQVGLLIADEFVMESGGSSLQQIAIREEFGPGEFVLLPDGKVVVCGHFDSAETNMHALGLISIILNCLSIVALAVIFLTYSIFSELRNTAGMFIMNLVGALFIALLLTVLGWNLQLSGSICLATACLVHFSWLAAFFWMARMSYDVAKTFGRQNVVRRRLRVSRRWLAVSMTLAWGGAFSIASVCVVIHLCQCLGLPPIYSESQPCWIASTKVNLIVFGIPVAASLLFSTACFSLIVYNIRKSKRDTKMIQTKGTRRELMDEFKIYCKLTLLFGSSWILAFVAAAVDHVVLDYLATIVNSLQGVLIFLAYCLNDRVRALWGKKLSLSSGESDTSPSAERYTRSKMTSPETAHKESTC